MPQPDSSRSMWVDRWSDSAPWPPDPEAPQGPVRRQRRRRCRDHIEDGRYAADVDGNEEQERQLRDAAAPSSRMPSSRMPAAADMSGADMSGADMSGAGAAMPNSSADSSSWVARLPFTSEELEDTWPNVSGRSIFDDDH